MWANDLEVWVVTQEKVENQEIVMTTKSINIVVAERVEKLGSVKIVDTVVEKLVAAEVAKRADALASALKFVEDTIREIRKASKPDQVSIAPDGVKTESFSAKAFEAKKKLDEKLVKIENAVVVATENGEWGKLYELVKGGGNQSATTDEPAENS